MQIFDVAEGGMTAQERALWRRVTRRAADVSPELAAELLRSFARIRDAMGEAALVRAIDLGFAGAIFDRVLTEAVLETAFRPLRERIRRSVIGSVPTYGRDIARAGRISGEVRVAFDLLDPSMIEAIRGLETRVITNAVAGVRATVKQAVERGLARGVNPRTMARELRGVIGLAPVQEKAVDNFRRALEGNSTGASPFDYELRDKRFDRTIAKGGLSPAQIDKMTDVYRKRFLAFNAETNARTAALDAQRLAQRMAWQDAVSSGVIEGGALVRTWRGTLDDRERPEHVAMEGDTVAFDQPHRNGQMIPGEDEYNCRCIDVYSVQKVA